jgi:hypothetical protein
MTGASFKTVLAVIAGGGAALALSALYRGDGREAATVPADEHAAHEAALAARATVMEDEDSTESTSTPPASAPTGPSRSERDLAWQTELRDASESFRNSTLLIAIRENDFPCDEVTSAEQGGDPLSGWRVTCRGALVYLVAVAASGQLVVEPIPMGDGLILSVPPRLEPFPREQLPNQPLLPPNR